MGGEGPGLRQHAAAQGQETQEGIVLGRGGIPGIGAGVPAGYGLRLPYLAEHARLLERTTLDEVAAAAAKYLAPARGVSVVLGDADRVEAPLAALSTVDRRALR